MGIRYSGGSGGSSGMGVWTDDGTNYVLTLDGIATPFKVRKSDNQLLLAGSVTDDAY